MAQGASRRWRFGLCRGDAGRPSGAKAGAAAACPAPQEHPENTQSAEIVIHRIPQAPPFPPLPDLPGGVQAAQRFASNSFAHFHVLPETSCDLFRIPMKRLYNKPEKMQGRRKSCVSGRPGRLRTRSYTSLTYTYLTLPYLGCRIDTRLAVMRLSSSAGYFCPFFILRTICKYAIMYSEESVCAAGPAPACTIRSKRRPAGVWRQSTGLPHLIVRVPSRKQKQDIPHGMSCFWYARRDSNPQPSEPESDALSIEPLAHTP